MSEIKSLAHPYASAIFTLAKAENKLDDWFNYLNQLSMIGQTIEFKKAICNPKISQNMLIEMLLNYLKTSDVEIKNFLTLLYMNKRLNILDEIFVLFVKLVSDYKGVAKAVIKSAFVMNNQDKEQIEMLLSKKFSKKIAANVEVNPELIGGIKIMIDDIVIDASIKGSLEKMATQLMK